MLSAAEKIVGRAFRDEQDAALADLPADIRVPGTLRFLRHECARRKTDILELREHYLTSPQGQAEGQDVPAGRFAFVYRSGQCSRCGLTAITTGRVVDAYERAPMTGRVAAR